MISNRIFTIATCLGNAGVAVMFFYISFYAEIQKITDTENASYMVPIFNAASCFGRVLPNTLADKDWTFQLNRSRLVYLWHPCVMHDGNQSRSSAYRSCSTY